MVQFSSGNNRSSRHSGCEWVRLSLFPLTFQRSTKVCSCCWDFYTSFSHRFLSIKDFIFFSCFPVWNRLFHDVKNGDLESQSDLGPSYLMVILRNWSFWLFLKENLRNHYHFIFLITFLYPHSMLFDRCPLQAWGFPLISCY